MLPLRSIEVKLHTFRFTKEIGRAKSTHRVVEESNRRNSHVVSVNVIRNFR